MAILNQKVGVRYCVGNSPKVGGQLVVAGVSEIDHFDEFATRPQDKGIELYESVRDCSEIRSISRTAQANPIIFF